MLDPSRPSTCSPVDPSGVCGEMAGTLDDNPLFSAWNQRGRLQPWYRDDSHQEDGDSPRGAGCLPAASHENEWLDSWRSKMKNLAAVPDSNEPPTLRRFEATHGVTAYRIRGPAGGPPVLCLHGLSLHGGMWDDMAMYLATRGYRVIALDFYGRGHSPWPGAHERLLQCNCSTVSCSEALLVEQAIDLLEHLGVKKLELLVGHSMGGGVAIALAARHPQLVQRVLVTAPVGLPKEAGASFHLPAALRRLLRWRSFRMGKRLSYRYWIISGRAAAIALGQGDDFFDRQKNRVKADAQIQLAADNLERDPHGFVDAWLSTLKAFPLGYGAPRGDLMRDYEAIGKASNPVPITLVWGVQDATCPISKVGQSLVRVAIPHAKLLILPEAAHAVVYEEAALVAQEIKMLLHDESLRDDPEALRLSA